MTTPRSAELASKLLARATSDAIDAPSAADRARAIAGVERALRRRSRRRLAMRWAYSAAAAVVLGLGARYAILHRGHPPELASLPVSPVVTVVGHPAGNGATLVDVGAPAPLIEGRFLARGNRVMAHSDGHVVLSLSTGTELTVEEEGDLSIVDSGMSQVFSLRAGAVHAHVAKLDSRQRFIIQTPDAEVEVRGTSFRVALVDEDPTCEGGTVTRVTVDEGVVSVRHSGQEARVGAGQRWPSSCAAGQEASVARPSKSALAVKHSREAARPAPPKSSEGAQVEATQVPSDLVEQNDRFSQALAAKERGAAREAVADFEAFVARYPSSPLVESALAQRMQLLRRIDPARAAGAAKSYLAHYPKGFARNDAEAIERQEP